MVTQHLVCIKIIGSSAIGLVLTLPKVSMYIILNYRGNEIMQEAVFLEAIFFRNIHLIPESG